MFDPQMELCLTVFQSTLAGSAGWDEARAAVAASEEVDEDVAAAVAAGDADALGAIVADWLEGRRHLLVHDRGVLKRAMKAYRKRLKVTVLDAESGIGGGPMSGGRRSNIVGIAPPERYPRAVWDELARQGRLIDAKGGMYELPPE